MARRASEGRTAREARRGSARTSGAPAPGDVAAPLPTETTPETKTRLLEAAGRVFGERGFRDATVREICACAGANLAAVNYHFRDKLGLYRATCLHAYADGISRNPVHGGVASQACPEERLRGFVRAFVARILDEDRPAWHSRLMARELADPTEALAAIVRDAIRPVYETLVGIVGELVPGAPREVVHMTAQSIIGQCTFHKHCAPIKHIFAQDHGLASTPAEVADHIACFSLSAIDGLRRRLASGHGPCGAPGHAETDADAPAPAHDERGRVRA